MVLSWDEERSDGYFEVEYDPPEGRPLSPARPDAAANMTLQLYDLTPGSVYHFDLYHTSSIGSRQRLSGITWVLGKSFINTFHPDKWTAFLLLLLYRR